MLEIGTYQAGTSEILARALRMNGHGKLITTDPFGQQRVPPILQKWPESLRDRVTYLPLSSMDCFIELDKHRTLFDFVFVDGDHSYESALFDLQMAAKRVIPGAVIVMDNAEQVGVYLAVRHFLSTYPGWKELGASMSSYDIKNPYMTMGESYPGTDFLILQAPQSLFISTQPQFFQTPYLPDKGLQGFDLALDGQQEDGILHVMVFFRSFWHGGYEGSPEQQVKIVECQIKKAERAHHVLFTDPMMTTHTPSHSFRSFEFILTWIPEEGSSLLTLMQPPKSITIA